MALRITTPSLSGLNDALCALNEGEDGHAIPVLGTLISGAGTIALGIGAANDTGWLAITGGIVAFLGAVVTLVLNHMIVEYNIFGRLDKLEGKK